MKIKKVNIKKERSPKKIQLDKLSEGITLFSHD
jgi:hypothetical protein